MDYCVLYEWFFLLTVGWEKKKIKKLDFSTILPTLLVRNS